MKQVLRGKVLRGKGFKIDEIFYQRYLPSFKQAGKHFEILKQIENFIKKENNYFKKICCRI